MDNTLERRGVLWEWKRAYVDCLISRRTSCRSSYTATLS